MAHFYKGHRSILGVVMALLFATLLYVFLQFFSTVLSDALIARVAVMLGMDASDVSPAAAKYVVFSAIVFLLLVAAFKASEAYQRHTIFVDDPNLPAGSLRQMSATEIAEYLRDKAVWGWRNYAQCNSWTSVTNFVPSEMNRAGKTSQVRYRATNPNATTSHDVDPSYWHHATIDGRIGEWRMLWRYSNSRR